MAPPHFLTYRDLQTSTSVHHVVYARLSCHDRPDVVLVRLNQVEMYQLVSTENGNENSNNDNDDASKTHPSSKLMYIDSCVISGDITAISTVSFPSGTHDSNHYSLDGILLTCETAKVSLMAYDQLNLEFITMMVFNFEENSIGLGSALHAERLFGCTQEAQHCVTKLAVDCQFRCAAVLCYSFSLMILPMLHPSNDFSILLEKSSSEDEPLEVRTSSMTLNILILHYRNQMKSVAHTKQRYILT